MGEFLSQCRQLRPLILVGFSGAQSFPDSSVGKESTCNAGDPGSIPRSGRSTGEGTGYPLQYSWASLVAQLVKNPPAMQETWVRSLGWEDPLEKGTATHSSILAWRIPWTVQSTGSQRVRHDFHFHWGPRAQHQRHSPIDSSSEYQHLSFALLFCWKATSVRAI